ncbi:unnamed protein product [Discosporangium mesarthrocarpum]
MRFSSRGSKSSGGSHGSVMPQRLEEDLRSVHGWVPALGLTQQLPMLISHSTTDIGNSSGLFKGKITQSVLEEALGQEVMHDIVAFSSRASPHVGPHTTGTVPPIREKRLSIKEAAKMVSPGLGHKEGDQRAAITDKEVQAKAAMERLCGTEDTPATVQVRCKLQVGSWKKLRRRGKVETC